MSIFKSMGFEYLRTDGKHKTFGNQKGEIDNIYLFENIILLVEETISEHDTDHIRKKNFYFEKIRENFQDFISWLKEDYPDKLSRFDSYLNNQYQYFYIYISDNAIDSEIATTFPTLKFIDNKSLKYFIRIASCLKLTSFNELLKFLSLDLENVGHSQSSTGSKDIDSAVILPESSSGFPEGIKVVTFLMKAKELMDCAYVLRKDSWDKSIGLYQRLIEKEKIERIRKFLSEKKRTFIDNIIVSLPYKASFVKNTSNEVINIFESSRIENITIKIPYKINSIGIIDGQHRVFGHYVGIDNIEQEIKLLREKRHLLVTGLYFDEKKFKDVDKRKFESELFLQINSKQKKVDKALLQYIESLNEPYSSIGVANNVLDRLNKRSPFLGLFVLSPLDKTGIKTPTVLQYGLQDLVEIDDKKTNLYKFWFFEKQLGIRDSDQNYEDYIDYCVQNISTYFCALKSVFNDDWDIKNKDSRLLSVTPLVAFLIAYKRSLDVFNGSRDFQFYKARFSNLEVNFKAKPFIYTSSQWTPLVEKIGKECWQDNKH